MQVRNIVERARHPERDRVEIIEIPDGLWVATAIEFARISIMFPSDQPGKKGVALQGKDLEPRMHRHVRMHYLIGVSPSETQRFVSRRHMEPGGSRGNSVMQEVTIVSPKPFGVLMEIEDSEHTWGKLFTVAGIVKNRRKDRKPRIRTPVFIGECRDEKGRIPKWARLIDAAGFASMMPGELLQRYIAFSDVNEPLLHVAFARSADEIRGKRIPYTRVSLTEAQQLLAEGQDRLWVRRGWVMTVLYLVHFGYRPVIRSALYAVSKEQ